MARELIMAGQLSGRPPESPLIHARALAGADLRNQASVTEVAWLHARPLLWLRALAQISAAARGHLDRATLQRRAERSEDAARRAAAGSPSGPQSAKTIAEVAELDRRQAKTRHFLLAVKRRQGEVQAMFPGLVEQPIAGEVIQALVSIETLLREGDTEAARDKALHWAHRLEQTQGNAVVVADNSQAAALEMILHDADATTIYCRVCWSGKVALVAGKTHGCPRCGQRYRTER